MAKQLSSRKITEKFSGKFVTFSGKIVTFEKIPGNFANPEDFRDPGNFPKLLGNFLKIFRFPGSLKSRKKGNPSYIVRFNFSIE